MLKLNSLILIWSIISVALGLGFTYIPWGDPEGFHGTGFPFASVYWDKIGAAKHSVDYPNPFAPLLNIAAFFLIGAIVIGSVWYVAACLQRRSLRIHPEGP